MKTAILKHMGIKKIIAVVFAGLFFVSVASAAASEVVVFTNSDPNRRPPCLACRDMRPVINALIAQGYTVRIINPEAPANAADAALVRNAGISTMPTTIVLNGNAEVGRIEGLTSASTLVDTFGNRLTTPQRPPSIPVPPDQLPDRAFTNPVNCSGPLTSGPHRGEYRCQYVNSERRLMEFFVGPDLADYFDTIANLARNNEVLLADPLTGAVRPMSRPPSTLPSTLPPVPGDPGYVPPRPRPPTPPPVIPGNENWTPVPTPPVGYPIRAANGRGYIITLLPGTIPISISGGDIDRRLQSSPDEGTRADVAVILARMGGVTPAPVAPGSTPPVVRPPTNTAPAAPAPERHVLGTPRLVDGVWQVRVETCTDTTCTVTTVNINNSSTVSTAAAAAAAALRQSVEAPTSRPSRPATVTPNAPPPGGSVGASSAISAEEMRRIEAETRRVREENHRQNALNMQRGGNPVIRPRP